MEQALANAMGLRVLSAIVAAVPVRLMKRDLLFIAERVMPMLDERRLDVVARNRGIRKAKRGIRCNFRLRSICHPTFLEMQGSIVGRSQLSQWRTSNKASNSLCRTPEYAIAQSNRRGQRRRILTA